MIAASIARRSKGSLIQGDYAGNSDVDIPSRALNVDEDRPLAGCFVEFLTGLSRQVVEETAHDGFDAGHKMSSCTPHMRSWF